MWGGKKRCDARAFLNRPNERVEQNVYFPSVTVEVYRKNAADHAGRSTYSLVNEIQVSYQRGLVRKSLVANDTLETRLYLARELMVPPSGVFVFVRLAARVRAIEYPFGRRPVWKTSTFLQIFTKVASHADSGPGVYYWRRRSVVNNVLR